MIAGSSPRFLSTTTNALDGFRVVQTYGVVRGIVVRSRGAIGQFGAKLQMLFGGDITLLTDLCERTRSDAYDTAVVHAQSLGANALLALRYDATEVMPGVTEVLCYGTAARVAPVKEPDAPLPRA
ncbi:MAG: YbjQ family protein [Gemmatimonadales bacterium]